ncbi:MAG: Type 1 glutamine amidotransferase-like domain-containing protein [Acidobacteria bacterium]|nr:Type 1 glutamine amidotransferase-like domain-containing protein [Acidobacteriota bacterium]
MRRLHPPVRPGGDGEEGGSNVESKIQPILLLADSQLLFWRHEGDLFLSRIREMLDRDQPRAAYVGASNGDQPEFYMLFQGAMEGAGIDVCRMIPSEPEAEDLDFLASADLILLAGGDPWRGWQVMQQNGLLEKVVERYYAGALLIGVSAGAAQLGLYGLKERDGKPVGKFEAFKLVPYLIDVHDEPEWPRMHLALGKIQESLRGLGIPTGGGALVHPDLTVEPLRHPLTEFHLDDEGEVVQALLFPTGEGEVAVVDEDADENRRGPLIPEIVH